MHLFTMCKALGRNTTHKMPYKVHHTWLNKLALDTNKDKEPKKSSVVRGLWLEKKNMSTKEKISKQKYKKQKENKIYEKANISSVIKY